MIKRKLLGAWILLGLLGCPHTVEKPSGLPGWPRLPLQAVFSGRVWIQEHQNTYRGKFFLRYTPDSVWFVFRGMVGMGPSYRGVWNLAPPELQALHALIQPSFCGEGILCTPAGTLEVRGTPLPQFLQTRPATLQVKILQWKRDSFDIPIKWVVQSPTSSASITIENYRPLP